MAKNLGVMVDCSRNAVLSVTGVKKLVDYLQKMGYAYLHLYTEDTYELEGEPFFGYMRGRYTAAEIREIDDYCYERGIELIPCVETLAHLERIFKWGAYASIRDCNDILLVGEEATYRFIDKIFDFCEKNFRSRKINLGMDEAHSLGRGRYFDLHGNREQFDIFAEHLQRVCEMAKARGFAPTIWSDMFFRTAAKGEYLAPDVRFPDEVKKSIPQGVTLCYWDYFTKEKSLYDGMLKKHLELTEKLSFAGGAVSWSGFHSANYISTDRLPTAISACKENGVENVLVTMWGDGGAECSCFTLLPSLFVAAESFYGRPLEGAEQRFFDLFGERFEDFLLFDLQIPVSVPSQDDIASGAKEMLYSDYFNGFLDSTVTENGEEARAYALFAEKLKGAAERSPSFGYLFRAYAALCETLSVKYDLGARTRRAYNEGGRVALKALIPDYERVETLVKAFADEFEKCWFTDRKPHGFDVQDLRLGGLLRRTKSCKRRLLAYINGEIERIEELETELVDFYGGDTHEKKLPYYNGRYTVHATSNGF